MDGPDPTKSIADVYLVVKKRASFTSERKVVDMIASINGDIDNQENICWIWRKCI